MMSETPLQPLVSVIVPVFNVAPYLSDCIESILAQTHERLDVILVDDGSTDGSGGMCDRYQQRDERIRVIHQENSGLSAARNTGLEASQGRWLTFIDSDDWVDAGYVRKLLLGAQQTGAPAVICGHVRVGDKEAIPSKDAGDGLPELRVLTPNEALLEFLGPDYPTMTVVWGKLFDSSLFDGVQFPVDRKHEDEYVTYRVLHRATRIALTTTPCYFYRQRPKSMMSSEFGYASRIDRLEAFEQRAEFMKTAGLGNIGYRPLLDEQMALWQLVSKQADPVVQSAFKRGLRGSVRRLRATRQPVAFRALAEAYFLAPEVADVAYRWYMRHHVREGP